MLNWKENKFFGVNLGVNRKKLKFGGLKLDFKKLNWSN